jgi:DNA replication protein DnaC
MAHLPREAALIAPALARHLRDLAAGRAEWPLYLWGGAGTGKTCAALWLLDQVPWSLYVDLERLADIAYDRHAALWEDAPTYHLAVVDEIGLRVLDSDREYLALKRMADLREMAPTIWISNLSPGQLRQTFDDRIYSRICSGSVVHLTGPDRRCRNNGGA